MASILKILIFIGTGSFLGGVARYGVSRLLTHVAGLPSFWGTFAANIAGCFLIGLFYGLFSRHGSIGEHWRLFLTVGFCGGFTTFSTFVNESYTHASQGHFLLMILYAVLSFALGLVALYLGQYCAGGRGI